MHQPRTAASVLHLPRRTLRTQLALLYAALFCISAVALAAVAEIFKPNFLVHTGSQAAPGTPGSLGHPVPCCQSGPSFTGTVAHDASQNLAGVAMVVVLAVLALGVGWLIAGRVLRPLRTITATARDISARNLHQRLALDGPDDEFRQLGETLDGLFGRLEASFQAQRHFVANASHELRTPLAAERPLSALSATRPPASPAGQRARARADHRPGHRQRARRHPHPEGPARRRPRHHGELSLTPGLARPGPDRCGPGRPVALTSPPGLPRQERLGILPRLKARDSSYYADWSSS